MVMNKEVIFVGILAVLCLGLLGVAFLGPKKAPKDTTPPASTDTSTTPAANPDDLTAGSTATTNFGQGSTPTPNSPNTTTTPFGTNPTGGTTGGGTPFGGSTSAATAGGGTFGTTTGGGFTGGTTGGGFASTSPAVVTPAPTDAGPKTYTVASGDTLADISMHFYGSTKHVKDILKANPGVVPEDLKIGQKLIIPDIGTATAATNPTPGATPGTGTTDAAGTYTVKAGDTLYGIAQRELGSPSKANIKAIASLNGMDVDDDLQVGKVLKMPAKADGTAVSPTNATPSPTPGADAGTGDNTYTIESGDTLQAISKKKYGTSGHWKAILAANAGLDPSDLKVGQKITLPDLPSKAAPTPTPAATGGTTGGGTFGTTAGATTGGGTFGTAGGTTSDGSTGGGFQPSATGSHPTSLDSLTPPPAPAPTPAPNSP